jgi:hypothetical protein
MSRAGTWLTLVAALSGGAGCTVTALGAQDDSRPNNTCQSDSDCSTGNCGAGVCQAINGQLEALLVSVSPPTGSVVPHLTFVTHLADVPTSGGRKDIDLPEPGHITGSLVVADRGGCYPTFVNPEPAQPIFPGDGKSLPARVSFERRERLLGLPQQSYFAESAYDSMVTGAYRFDFELPAGQYDVYFFPPATFPDCSLPPQLRRGWSIKGGEGTVPFVVAPVLHLALRIRWPKLNESLKGWQLDMIEPLDGKAISTVATLGDPTDGEQTVEYLASLAYSEVIEAEGSAPSIESANDLLRLRPPEGVIAPTIFFDRSGLGLFGGAEVTLKELTTLPKPVTIEGQAVRADTGAPVRGSVTLLSKKISGVNSGVFASFQTTATVDEQGVFRLDIPPGTYVVRAVPLLAVGQQVSEEDSLAAYETTWEIPGDVAFQAGKLLELSPLNQVTGQSRFPGAQVQAVATQVTVLPFDEGFGASDFLPRGASGLVDEAGHFTLLADRGKFDISVQGPESLGFAWYVRPGFDVHDPRQDLGPLSLPTPVALTGQATIGSGSAKLPVGSGVVRAYAYLDKNLAYTRDPKEAVSVVQVAETRADERGDFRLLLPSSITAPK